MEIEIYSRPFYQPVITADEKDICICYNGKWVYFKNGDIIVKEYGKPAELLGGERKPGDGI